MVLLYWRLHGSARLSLVVLSSLFFYMSWLPAYGLLLLLISSVNWLLGLGMAKEKSGSPLARAYLIVGLFINLGCLCYYKYAGFILENLFAALNGSLAIFSSYRGMPIPAYEAPVINALLPLGISFFVFEFVHYLVDVFKGSPAVKSWSQFVAFAAFFPSQIAGPIKRYQDFLGRLANPLPLNGQRANEALNLIVQGLFKKVAIADPIGAVIYPAFAQTSALSTGDALIASLGFVVQVYCDFSGYTDIGRGSALLLGIPLPENFRLPYLAPTLAEFWRRWHMSLSLWLRDYIYIPLGGSKGGTLVTWRNLFITMFACGLWHGASWHYVIFGCLQGLGLIVQRQWQSLCSGFAQGLNDEAQSSNLWQSALGIFMTMTFITLTFVVFRAPDMSHAMNVFAGYLNFAAPCQLALPLTKSGACVFTLAYFVFWLFRLAMDSRIKSNSGPLTLSPHLSALRPAFRYAAYTAACILMLAATPTEAVPFVYFQF